MKGNSITKFHLVSRLGFLIGFFLLFAQSVSAATLYFSPSSGNITVGNILSTSVLVNTQGTAVNNADAVINFPANLLEVVSVNKSGSIFSLWVEEPAFSNSAGTITFNGGLPTPGYNGSAGRLLNIVFRAKNIGSASVIFSSGAVRANDGYGTDVLQTKAQAQFTLVSEERPVLPPPAALGTPQAPVISSPTHPDSTKWYSASTAIFNWPTSADVTGTRLLVGRLSIADPAVLYVPPINQKTIEGLEEGIWYFHAQMRNDNGWGGISHFRLQVDTENPERFDVKIIPRDDATEPRVKFMFDAQDKTSGIDHYEIQIDGKDTTIWSDDGTKTFQTPVLEPGTHILVAKAVDKAGNSLTNSTEFEITPLFPPIITEYPKELGQGEILVVRGTTYPEAEVTIWLQRDTRSPEAFTVHSDTAGEFTFITDDGIGSGVYKLWAKVIDKRGASSNPSERLSFVVKQATFLKIGTFAIGILSLAIPILGLLILLIFILWYSWHRFTLFKKQIRKEVRDVESSLHKAFDLLREDIREQIKMLEKVKNRRKLTEEEERIIGQLRKDLDDAEKFVRKEIEDVEEKVK